MTAEISSKNLTPSLDSLRAEVKDFNFFYGKVQALKNANLKIPTHQVTALIGPSGCGKTTLLRCFNRMHELYSGNRHEGEILLYPEGLSVFDPKMDPIEIRMRITMVFQKPNPFPKSIFENVVYGLKIRGEKNKSNLQEKCEEALKNVALWDEVKDKLQSPGYSLSGGQQQRLCIARALAVDPSILLMDEPTSALDPISTGKIEELICGLKEKVTILMVTHNMQQAQRISQQTAFFYLGEIIEYNSTQKLFSSPQHSRTQDYLSGRFG